MKKLTIVKVGGNVLESIEMRHQFLNAVCQLTGNVWIVHGGGKDATKMADSLGIPSTFIDGRRVTSDAFLEVAVNVYSGINKRLVASLQAKGRKAIGLCGADLGLVLSKKRQSIPIDFGMVGDPIETVIDKDLVDFLLHKEVIAVFNALSFDPHLGTLLNTNADSVARVLATNLSQFLEVELVLAFEKKGVMLDINDESSLVGFLNRSKIQKLKAEGVIVEGMIPKVDNAVLAIGKGVKSVRISSYYDLHGGTLIQS